MSNTRNPSYLSFQNKNHNIFTLEINVRPVILKSYNKFRKMNSNKRLNVRKKCFKVKRILIQGDGDFKFSC